MQNIKNTIKIIIILLVIICIFISIALYNPRQRLLTIEKNNQVNPYSKCLLMTETSNYPECKVGNGKVSAIVLGDSFGNSLFTAVAKANTQGATLQWTYAGCFAGFKTKQTGYEGCRKFIKDKLKTIKQYKSVPIIFINATETANNETQQKENIAFYKKTLCQFSENNPIYIVKKPPSMDINVPKYLALTDTDYTLSLDKYKKQLTTIEPILNILTKECNAIILDPTPYLCKNNQCLGSKDKKPLYYDRGHMNEYGNSFLIPLFKTVFN